MHRRDFLGAAVAAGVVGGLGRLSPGSAFAQVPMQAPGRGQLPVGPARNIIFFAYDGFGYEDLAAAKYFGSMFHDRPPLTIEAFLGNAASGLTYTHSADSIVTDSSAAATAWSTGRKVLNSTVGVDVEGRPLTQILEIARGQGRATGLITSTRLTHATPASWVAKVDHRDREDEIAAQYLAFGPDVLLGGGSRHFDPAVRPDGRDLFAEFESRGYQLVRDAAALNASNASRLLGSFSSDHLPYEIDRRFQSVPSPTLAELTRKGLQVLAGNDGGFVVQIEAGRIDHANHQNDPGAMVWDVLAADDALREAIAFVDSHPDTLLIVAADHTTGGGAVFGAGTAYRGTNEAFGWLARRRGSQERMMNRLGGGPSAVELREAIESTLGVPLSANEADHLADAFARRRTLAHPAAQGSDRLHSIHFMVTSRDPSGGYRLNFNYATGAHTASPSLVGLYGAGTQPHALGLIDNTDLFGWMTAALGADVEPAGAGQASRIRELVAMAG